MIYLTLSPPLLISGPPTSSTCPSLGRPEKTIDCHRLFPALNLNPLTIGSLGSSTRTILPPMTRVPIIVTASAYMWALFPSMPLTSTNITSPQHRKAISRVSLLTPLKKWIYWSLLLYRPSNNFESLSRLSSPSSSSTGLSKSS